MNRRVELAFGSGQFVCMGRPIALVEAYKALAEVSTASLRGGERLGGTDERSCCGGMIGRWLTL